ncbi:MAG TPA: non-homologous end-joining DNA ligase [Acidimicrobiales bacterium]|nr:non-homologous end-joining DNA ligase [Acidimicrobiales bacterium]
MAERVITVEGRDVRMSSLERVLWPGLGLTKAWLADYYVRIAPVLLPHLRRHPITLHRFPEGVTGPHFFQTRVPPRPEWVEAVTFRMPRTGKVFDVAVVDDLAGLLWAVNLSTIELHPYLGVVGDLDHPAAVVFDLDAGPPAGLHEACAVALLVRDLCRSVGLASYAKTSGGGGMHVYVPVTSATYDETKAFARAIAGLLAREFPDRVVDKMTKSLRAGKVFIDWSQNDPGKSTVVAYSIRATTPPLVSAPVTWGEVEEAVAVRDARPLLLGPDDVLRRVDDVGDLWAPVLAEPQPLRAFGR